MVIRVTLIDDDQYIHDAINALLRQVDDMVLVGQGYRGTDAPDICRLQNPDLVLMDVVMPGMNGAETTRIILSQFPHIKVLGLSSYRDYEHIKALIEAGASGYLFKNTIANDLLDTIRATAQGNTVLSADAVQALISPSQPDTFGLTDREHQVIQHIASGMNNREVASALNVSERTVRFHLNNILEKFGVGTRSEALVMAAKNNLV